MISVEAYGIYDDLGFHVWTVFYALEGSVVAAGGTKVLEIGGELRKIELGRCHTTPKAGPSQLTQ